MEQQKIAFDSCGDAIKGDLFLPSKDKKHPALLICHAGGDWRNNYFELAEHAAQNGVAALAIDMHGHGESGGPRYHIEMKHWVADVKAAIDFLSAHSNIDPNNISVFGLSSGGTAILEAAVEDKRIKSAVALDSTVRTMMPFFESLFVRILIAVGKIKKLFTGKPLTISLAKMAESIQFTVNKDINTYVIERLKEAKIFVPFPGTEDSFFVDTLTRVHKITCPTRVIWGAEDKVDNVQTAHLLYEALTCEKDLQIVEGNGHAGHVDQHKQKVFDLTLDWIKKHA